jgi:hypothetical protein
VVFPNKLPPPAPAVVLVAVLGVPKKFVPDLDGCAEVFPKILPPDACPGGCWVFVFPKMLVV